MKNSSVWDFKMWLLAVLIGDRQLTRVFYIYKIYKIMYGRFAGPKRNGHNNEMTVLPRKP